MSGRGSLLLVVLLLGGALPVAAAVGAPPPGATAQCRDGTYSYSQHHSGTCSHHGGVAVWLDSSGTGGGGSSSAGSGGASSSGVSGACGVERWTVKSLQDRPTLLPAA